jgi:hypothetical protein
MIRHHQSSLASINVRSPPSSSSAYNSKPSPFATIKTHVQNEKFELHRLSLGLLDIEDVIFCL